VVRAKEALFGCGELSAKVRDGMRAKAGRPEGGSEKVE
jgi:hypothetical protein